MTTSCNESYLIRVNHNPPNTQNAILVYTSPTSPTTPSMPVNTISVLFSKTLCFSEATASTVKNVVLSVENCGNCTMPGVWDSAGKVLVVQFNGPGGDLGLKAVTVAGVETRASSNPPGIQGGRPIIRYPPYLFVAIGFALLAVVVIVYVYKRLSRERTVP